MQSCRHTSLLQCGTPVLQPGILKTAFGWFMACHFGLAAAAAENTEEGSARDETTPAMAITEEIVVHANRVDDTKARVPVPIEVLLAADLERQGVIFINELLLGAAGAAVTQLGGTGSRQELRMRGAEANHAQIHLDGIALNDPARDDTVELEHINLFGMRQFELLKGAQSGLWGSGALAGTIHLHSIPARDSAQASLKLGYGNRNTQMLSGGYERERHGFYLNLAGSHYETAGHSSARKGAETDNYHNTTVHLHAGRKQSDWSIRTVIRGVDSSTEYDAFTNGRPRDGNLHTDSRSWYGLAQATLHIGPFWHSTMTMSSLTSVHENLTDTIRDSQTRGSRHTLSWQNELHVRGRPGLDQRLVMAVEYQRSGFRQRARRSVFGDPNQRQEIRQTSLIIVYGLPGERFTSDLALRFDANSAFRDGFSHRISAKYQLHPERTTLSATVATGIKNPTFIERFGYTPDSFVGNSDLDPEISRSLSIHLEHRVTPRFDFSIALFRDRLKDEIDGFFFVHALGTFTAVNRSGTSRRQGVEFTTGLRFPGIRLRFEYGYLHATEQDFVTKETREEIRRPRHTARALVDITYRRNLQTHLRLIHVGARKDLDFASFPATLASLDAYFLTDLYIAWNLSPHQQWFMKINNIFDANPESVLGYGHPRRMLLAGVTLRLP